MAAGEIAIYTIEDLERERGLDERLRWELVEGELVMTPSPRSLHQQLALRLAVKLLEAVDHDLLDVIPAPIDLHLSDRTVLQPDLLVVALEQIRDEGVVGAPVLAVEVLSPSTRRRDLVTKFGILERARCPHYWVLDPDEVSLRVWDLVSGRYRLHVHAVGDQEVRLTEPAELAFRVADLLPPRR